ncbi:MAG: DUF3298 and DUF4163 domain-containing protein [Lachnospiraceae bacterium]|nr:DUF3298 and DUF4163 domain-containing protein [Lachnospiraceae bacterium]
MKSTDNKDIQNLKNAYKNIPVPEEAKKRIETGIAKANEKNRDTKIVTFAKGFGITVAAAMVTITVLANSNQSVAHAMTKIPIIGSFAKIVTFRDYQNETKDFNASVKVPKIESDDASSSDSKNLKKTNKSIEEYANEFISLYETDLKASNGEGNYSLESDYKVIRETDQYLAIKIDTTLVMASGTQFTKVFNVDKTTGSMLNLSDFFQKDSDYIKVISDNIKKQMEEQMKSDENISYFYNSDVPEWDFQTITEDTSFYFNEKEELVLNFNEYEVAPGYMGAVSFTIPRSVTDPLLK